MKGELRAIVITPETMQKKIDVKHWLISQKVTFEERKLQLGDEERALIFAAVDGRLERLFRMSFKSEAEKVKVFSC